MRSHLYKIWCSTSRNRIGYRYASFPYHRHKTGLHAVCHNKCSSLLTFHTLIPAHPHTISHSHTIFTPSPSTLTLLSHHHLPPPHPHTIFTSPSTLTPHHLLPYPHTTLTPSHSKDYGIWERGDKINHGETELNATSIGMAKVRGGEVKISTPPVFTQNATLLSGR